MATTAMTGPATKGRSLAPDRTERVVGVLSAVLLTALAAALLRGRPEWAEIPALLWAHLATIALALAITPVLMLRRRGDRWHRRFGWAWSMAMLTTALISFGIRFRDDGRLSEIHILSAIVLLSVPLIVFNARRHKVDHHRRAARGLTIGALLVAGFLTFPFDRLLGRWLLG